MAMKETGTEEHQELMPLKESKLRLAQVSDNSELILKLADDFDIDTTESAESLIKEGVADINKSMFVLVRSGVRLSLAKDKCKHGEFSSICEQMGLSTFRASEAMRYAKYLSTIPEKDRSKFLSLPKKSALVLGNSDPEVIEFLLEDENYEKAKTLKNKTQLTELVEDLQKAEDINEQQGKELEAAREENLALKEAQQQTIAGSQWPEHVAMLRKESLVLGDEARTDLLSIERLAVRFKEITSGADAKALQVQQQAGLYPALSQVADIAGHALELFFELCEHNGINPTEIASFAVPLDEDELEIARNASTSLMNQRLLRGEARRLNYTHTKAVSFNPGRPFEYLNFTK